MKNKFIVTVFLLSMVTSIYAIGSESDDSYKELKVVDMHTVLGSVENPDVFFEGTYFEDIKPTKMLKGKSKYDRGEERRNATGYQNIIDHDMKNPKSRVNIYKVKKVNSAYTFWFDCEAEERSSNVKLRGETIFSNAKELRVYAKKIDKRKSLPSMEGSIKIYDMFNKSEFENISKEILQETEDYIETMLLIDNCYMCVIFQKIYK